MTSPRLINRMGLMVPAPVQDVAPIIARFGGIEDAIRYSANNGDHDTLEALLAEKDRQEEAADPLLAAKRLRQRGAVLDASGERMNKQAAEFYGKAAWRRQRGEADLAQGFQAQADAAQALSDARYDEAAKLRAEARKIERRAANASALALVVGVA